MRLAILLFGICCIQLGNVYSEYKTTITEYWDVDQFHDFLIQENITGVSKEEAIKFCQEEKAVDEAFRRNPGDCSKHTTVMCQETLKQFPSVVERIYNLIPDLRVCSYGRTTMVVMKSKDPHNERGITKIGFETISSERATNCRLHYLDNPKMSAKLPHTDFWTVLTQLAFEDAKLEHGQALCNAIGQRSEPKVFSPGRDTTIWKQENTYYNEKEDPRLKEIKVFYDVIQCIRTNKVVENNAGGPPRRSIITTLAKLRHGDGQNSGERYIYSLEDKICMIEITQK